MSNSADPIEILSDDEEAPAPATAPAASRRRPREEPAGSKDAAIDLDDDDAVAVMAAPPPSGRSDHPVTLDDDDPAEREAQRRRRDAAACRLCESDRLRNAYKLKACSHSFCRSCLVEHVERKLRRFLAHEVACPTCEVAMTILDVQTLSAAGKAARPRAAAPPPPLLPPGIPPHLAAALGLGGGGFGGGGFGGGGGASSSGGGGGAGALGRTTGTAAATKRLMREFQAIQKADTAKDGFEVSMADETDLWVPPHAPVCCRSHAAASSQHAFHTAPLHDSVSAQPLPRDPSTRHATIAAPRRRRRRPAAAAPPR